MDMTGLLSEAHASLAGVWKRLSSAAVEESCSRFTARNHSVGLRDSLPRRIGVVACHRLGDALGLDSQIPLIDDAIAIDDERHHTGDVVLRGPWDERKAPRIL